MKTSGIINDEYDKGFFVIKLIVGFVIVGIFLTFIFGSFYIVSAGERAVISTLGNPDMVPNSEGLHFKFPLIQKVVIFDVKTQKYEADASAASRDLQIVTSKIATNYHLTPESVSTLYKEIGVDYQSRIIQPVEQEIVKSVTAKYDASELITKREEVRLDIKQSLHDRLITRGIIVEDVSITNFDFSPEFNTAIEQKVVALQLKQKAENDLERIKIEAEQIITRAQAEAESLRLKKMQVTPELVQLNQLEVQSQMIAKWNGIMPTTLVSGQSTFANLFAVSNSNSNGTGS